MQVLEYVLFESIRNCFNKWCVCVFHVVCETLHVFFGEPQLMQLMLWFRADNNKTQILFSCCSLFCSVRKEKQVIKELHHRTELQNTLLSVSFV